VAGGTNSQHILYLTYPVATRQFVRRQSMGLFAQKHLGPTSLLRVEMESWNDRKMGWFGHNQCHIFPLTTKKKLPRPNIRHSFDAVRANQVFN